MGLSTTVDTGAAWVYTRSGGVWTQQGSKLVGTGAIGAAQQGVSVSLSSDGNTAIVGGPGDNGGTGAAWVYTRSGGVWTQQGSKLVGTGAIGAAQQGRSVSLSSDGNTAIVGGPGDNGGQGAAWVYTRSGGVWTQQGNKLVGTGASGAAQQGVSVSLSVDGNTAIVGGLDDNGGAGAAWVYVTTLTAPPLVMIGQLPPATIGLPYSQTLTASGGTPPYVWSVVSGALPDGIALSPNAGVLSGTPTAPGSFTFAVGVSNSTTPTQLTATKTLTLTVGFRPGSASDHEPIAASDDRAAVQPNPNSERGNAALCVVRGERRPAKWNCVVTKCGGVVGNANPERYCHLHCDGNRLDCHWCANGDRKIRSDCRIAGVNDPLARQ